MRKKQKEEASDIAGERINRLFELAEKAAKEGDIAHANRYVELAWKIKLKFRAKLSPYQKRLFCRKCLKFLADGKTGRYRAVKGVMEVKCLGCGYTRKYLLKPKAGKVRASVVKDSSRAKRHLVKQRKNKRD